MIVRIVYKEEGEGFEYETWEKRGGNSNNPEKHFSAVLRDNGKHDCSKTAVKR